MKRSRIAAFVFLLTCSNLLKGQTSGMAVGTDHTPISYKLYGTGKPLLIINGGPGMNSDGFQSLAIRLSINNEIILYDQRGTGKSTLSVLDTNTITMDLMISDIEQLRKHLKIEKWAVLGHSFGGMLASYYATKYPEIIDKIILSSSGGIDLGLLDYVGTAINSRLSKGAQDSVAHWNKKISEGDTSHYARLERGKNLAPAYVMNKKYVPVIAERLTQSNSLVNELVWINLQKIKFDCAPRLKTFDKPVLIIQGQQDIVSAETAQKAHKVFSKSSLVFMEHCIHYGWLDNEEVYFKTLNSFLAK